MEITVFDSKTVINGRGKTTILIDKLEPNQSLINIKHGDNNDRRIDFNNFNIVSPKAKVFGSLWTIRGVKYRYVAPKNPSLRLYTMFDIEKNTTTLIFIE